MLGFLAERRISQAIAEGELEGLPGEGKPLDLEDDPLVPEDLRMVYRILKNAGYAPPEVEDLKDARKLAFFRLRIEAGYYDKVARKLGTAPSRVF